MTIETTPTVPVTTPDAQPTGALPAIQVPEDLPDAVEIDLSDAAAPPIEKPVAAEHPPAEEPPAEERTPRTPVPIRRQVQAAREAERAAVERAERAEADARRLREAIEVITINGFPADELGRVDWMLRARAALDRVEEK